MAVRWGTIYGTIGTNFWDRDVGFRLGLHRMN